MLLMYFSVIQTKTYLFSCVDKLITILKIQAARSGNKVEFNLAVNALTLVTF